eukprot:315182_1
MSTKSFNIFKRKKPDPPPRGDKVDPPPRGDKVDKNELDKKIINLMDQLNIPKSGREGLLKMPETKKRTLLKEYQAKLSSKPKSKKSAKEWSHKLKGKKIAWKLLSNLKLVIQDSSSSFSREFIQELGLKHICRISQQEKNANDTKFQKQILLIFKALIDSSPENIRAVVDNDQFVATIVSKVDSKDKRIREISLKLLVTLVVVENDNLSLLACSKIMRALSDLSRDRGHSNRWKLIIPNLSVNQKEYGSFEYDNYALMLINFVVSCLETVDERTDERRLLN